MADMDLGNQAALLQGGLNATEWREFAQELKKLRGRDLPIDIYADLAQMLSRELEHESQRLREQLAQLHSQCGHMAQLDMGKNERE